MSTHHNSTHWEHSADTSVPLADFAKHSGRYPPPPPPPPPSSATERPGALYQPIASTRRPSSLHTPEPSPCSGPGSPNSAAGDDIEGERRYPETTRRPNPLDQTLAEVHRALRSQPDHGSVILPSAPASSLAPSPLRPRSAPARPSHSNDLFGGMAEVPYLGALGAIMPFPALEDEANTRIAEPWATTTTTAATDYSSFHPLPTPPPHLRAAAPKPPGPWGGGHHGVPMWKRALVAARPAFPCSATAVPAPVAAAYLRRARAIDGWRNGLVGAIAVRRRALRQRQRQRQRVREQQRDDAEPMKDLWGNVVMLHAYDAYHWASAPAWGEEDEEKEEMDEDDDGDDRCVRETALAMGRYGDWSPSFNWEQPFAPAGSRGGRAGGGGGTLDDGDVDPMDGAPEAAKVALE